MREGIAKLKKDSPLTCHWTQKQNTRTTHLCAWCPQAQPADTNVDDVTRQFDKERSINLINEKLKVKPYLMHRPVTFLFFFFSFSMHCVQSKNQKPKWSWLNLKLTFQDVNGVNFLSENEGCREVCDVVFGKLIKKYMGETKKMVYVRSRVMCFGPNV